MDFTDFARNIEEDIIFGTIPLTSVKLASTIIAGGGFKGVEMYKDELARFTAQSATSVVARNISKYVLTNTAKKPINFSKKLAIHFSSRAIGTLAAQTVFSKDKSIKSMILFPLCTGALSTVNYMIVNHDESSRYLRAYFPHLHNSLKQTSSAIGLEIPMQYMFDMIDGKK